MLFEKSVISFFATLLFVAFTVQTISAQPQRAYERGIEELYRGNTTLALDLWYSAYERAGGVDARIGFEYIRVVTENRMRSYYEPASEVYFRALTDGEGTHSRVALRQEIERMKPVIGEGIYRQWINWWDDQNPELGADMRGYWVQQDPTPAQVINERLIEHWERIAIAKNRFKKNNNTVFGTDDRALIFIRYGEPDRINNGILTLQSANIKPWISRQLLHEQKLDEMQNRDMETAADEDVFRRLQNAMYQFHRYPEYEVWIYETISDLQGDPVIFLFGTDVRNDEFRLQTSLEGFIPERAFHIERDSENDALEFTRAGFTPALMLQLLYYEQLAGIDPFFENRLNQLRDRILDQREDAYRNLDLAFRSESAELIQQRTIRAPREKSTYQEMIPKIPVHVYQYRFLDEDLEPTILTYLESFAQEAFLIDYHRGNGRNSDSDIHPGLNVLDEFTFYELLHNLQTYDSQWRITESNQDDPPLVITFDDNEANSNSVFISPHKRRAYQSISVVLLNHNPDSRALQETPFSEATRGWNKLQFRQPMPLKSHPDTLEVADLILGYPDEDHKTEPFNFRVANNQIIPFGETLLLHFEVYNLERMANNFTQFELTYRIFPVDDDGNVLTDQTEFILTLNFTNEERRVVEDLEIETAELLPGLYELVVYIQDTVTEQNRERRIRFEVVE